MPIRPASSPPKLFRERGRAQLVRRSRTISETRSAPFSLLPTPPTLVSSLGLQSSSLTDLVTCRAMLSRLKRRTPPVNSAVDDSPDPSNHPSVVTEFGRAVSPSPSRRPQAATAPSRGSSYVDPDAPNPYGLSPERARSRTSRSSSFSSAGAGDRRSANYSMPEPRSLAVGRGGLIGEGSLKLDQISSGGGGATLLVQAPELMLALGDLEPNGYHSESDLRTPVPGLNGVNAFDIFPPTSPPITRARSATTASQRPSGLDALADINVPSTPSFASALATPHDPHTADRSRSRTSSFTNGERPALASPTITTTTSASSSRKSTLVQPDSYSNSKNSNKKSRSSTGGIASALALSGVTLASPSAQLRQPLALARVPTSTSSLGGRDSQDGVDSDGMSFGEQGFMSMDALGNFDDVVDQLGTGYAVASSKRNAEFHAIFKTIPDDDYLIEGGLRLRSFRSSGVLIKSPRRLRLCSPARDLDSRTPLHLGTPPFVQRQHFRLGHHCAFAFGSLRDSPTNSSSSAHPSLR